MKVTVCQLHDESDLFVRDWKLLCNHVQQEKSELVVLPEMVFSPWFAVDPVYKAGIWDEAVKSNDEWINHRIQELSVPVVAGSRAINKTGRRINEGFIWKPVGGYTGIHEKFYLPDEDGYWEASWYARGNGKFDVAGLSNGTKVGFLICTELWFMERARAYGKQGVQVILSPRATGKVTIDKWLVGGRADAVVSGAFSLSSNRFSESIDLGGGGWIIAPDGEILAKTSENEPFQSVEIDLSASVKAKSTYPRYVVE